MISKKKPGWEGRLIAYLARVGSFRPSETDCAMFFAGGVLATTGDDHAKKFRGKYRTIEAGKAMLNKAGFEDHVAYADSLFEQWESPLMGQRGDGAVVETADGVALGIIQGEYVYVMTLAGLGFVPLTMAKKAYVI